MTTSLAQAMLVITPIASNKGFTMINMGEGEIVNQTQTILHIINLDHIMETLDEIKKFEIVKQDLEIRKECITLYSKIRSIIPFKKRTKRGLINIVGTAQKWLFGTMDNNDREEIEEHLRTTDINTQNTVQEVNKQIRINTQLEENMKNIFES